MITADMDTYGAHIHTHTVRDTDPEGQVEEEGGQYISKDLLSSPY